MKDYEKLFKENMSSFEVQKVYRAEWAKCKTSEERNVLFHAFLSAKRAADKRERGANL